MAQLRRPDIRREPIRTVDAVVVAHDAAVQTSDQAPAEREARGDHGGNPPAQTWQPPPTARDETAAAELVHLRHLLADLVASGSIVANGRSDLPPSTLRPYGMKKSHPRAEPAAGNGAELPAHPRAPARRAHPTEGFEAPYDDRANLGGPGPADPTCRIAVWRGYVKTRFYAQAFDAQGDVVALAESPSFRWRGNGTPERTEAATKAHSALVELMRQTGWEPTRKGASWFDVTLTRR